MPPAGKQRNRKRLSATRVVLAGLFYGWVVWVAYTGYGNAVRLRRIEERQERIELLLIRSK